MGLESITRISGTPTFRSALKTGTKTDTPQQEVEQQGRKFLDEQKAAEDLKRKQEQQQELKEREQEQEMLEKQLEASRKEAESMEDMFEAFAKCIKIAARISKGDIVPMKDMKFLAEHEPDMYKQAILMRMPNDKPKKHKSLLDDDDEKTDEVSDSGSETSEGSGEEVTFASESGGTEAESE